MSSISNLPYGKILDYWYHNLKGHQDRNKFLITKLFEAFVFRSKGYSATHRHKVSDFPESRSHGLSIRPKIGVVIPVLARLEKDLTDAQNLFASIAAQTYEADQVIVVDDGSPLEFQVPDRFIKIRQDRNYGPAKARNRGMDMALERGMDIIAFTDVDCILDKDWFKYIIFHFQRHETCGLVSGNTISLDKHWFGNYHNINGTLNGRKFKDSQKLLYGTTANLAITSDVAREIRFNEHFPKAAGEDIEFCFRANKAGFKIMFNEKMVVYHHYGYNGNLFENLKRFRNQFKKYGEGERILLEQIPDYYAYFDKTEEIPAMQQSTLTPTTYAKVKNT